MSAIVKRDSYVGMEKMDMLCRYGQWELVSDSRFFFFKQSTAGSSIVNQTKPIGNWLVDQQKEFHKPYKRLIICDLAPAT